MRALFEGLVTFHISEDDTAAPGVAERWEPNEDFSVWTFYLREDAKWSNGEPITAHDFAYSYERVLTPELASPYASMLFPLQGAEEFNKGETDDFSTVGVKVIDDRTLELSLIGPMDYFPEVLKHTTWLPVPKETIEKFGKMTDRYTDWQRPGNHVGNGPFVLKSWRINHSLTVEPNSHYWDRETVKLNEIRFIPIPNEYTEERAFRDSRLHYTYTMPNNMIAWYRENQPHLLRTEPYAGSYFYRFNVNEPPMNDPKVRKALTLAIDREAIVKNVTQGGQEPSFGFTPPFKGVYEPPKMVEFNPGKARELLAEAGYPNGEGFPGFQILINTQEAHRTVAETIQAMWKEHLGIDNVTINNQEWKVFQQTLHDLNYEVARSGWIGDYVHPMTFLTMWQTDDTNNETGWSNAEYDRLIREAFEAADPAVRQEKMFAAEKILLDELPIAPIYWYTRVYLLHPDVKNWNPKVLDNRPFKHVDLIDSGPAYQ
ncbi:MAG: peptide ABC transporter substrate-binding protein [Verrucomicrobiales bacterium]|nr:peptide ABC transporter substrate-binding protein [Verrucomicrobiales bacterium]